ncbi:MAG: SOS response-associated peptidase [Pseudomonadota bacterium]
MCNLYSNVTAVEAMRQLFDVSAENMRLGNAEPRPSIYPKGMAPVVRLTEDGQRELIDMQWGFLTPKVSKNTGKPLKPAAWNNARDDKLRSSGLWRASFEHRRCLVPVSSFNETKGRQPATYYWFAMPSEDPAARPPFAIAGLWRTTPADLRSEAQSDFTHTMVTTEANDLVRPIHAKGRMPVILDPESYGTWLTGSDDEAFALLKPYPSERMRIASQGLDVRADPPPEAGLGS